MTSSGDVMSGFRNSSWRWHEFWNYGHHWCIGSVRSEMLFDVSSLAGVLCVHGETIPTSLLDIFHSHQILGYLGDCSCILHDQTLRPLSHSLLSSLSLQWNSLSFWLKVNYPSFSSSSEILRATTVLLCILGRSIRNYEGIKGNRYRENWYKGIGEGKAARRNTWNIWISDTWISSLYLFCEQVWGFRSESQIYLIQLHWGFT